MGNQNSDEQEQNDHGENQDEEQEDSSEEWVDIGYVTNDENEIPMEGSWDFVNEMEEYENRENWSDLDESDENEANELSEDPNYLQFDGCYHFSEYSGDVQNLNHFICPIGLGLLRNPVADSCGHLFCKACITQSKRAKDTCPISNMPLNLTPTIHAIRDFIGELPVECINQSNGCQWTGTIEKLEIHLSNECPFKIVPCPAGGCQEKIRKNELQNHLNQCDFRLYRCMNCGLIRPAYNRFVR